MLSCFLHDISYVGRLFAKSTGKPVEILTKLNEMAGCAPDEEIDLYEVCSLSHYYQLLWCHFIMLVPN